MQHPVQNSPLCPLWVVLATCQWGRTEATLAFRSWVEGEKALQPHTCTGRVVVGRTVELRKALRSSKHGSTWTRSSAAFSPFIFAVITTDSPEHRSVAAMSSPPPGRAVSLDWNCSDLEQDGSLVQLFDPTKCPQNLLASIHVLSRASWTALASWFSNSCSY